jgi:hypothetical protein
MVDAEDIEQELSAFIHDLFLKDEYIAWRKNLKSFPSGKWHSLIVKLDEYEVPLEEIKSFGNSIFSKLVFSYIEAPDYKKSQMLMVQFTVAEGLWHSLIWHCPERN